MLGVDYTEFKFIVKKLWSIEAVRVLLGGRIVRLRRLIAYRGLFQGYVERLREDYDLVMELS